MELNDIKNLEVIDLNDSEIEPKSSNVLDEINNQGITGKISKEDKSFFKEVFNQVNEAVEPRGKDYVEPKPAF